jgi:hypothetical protein
MRQRAWSTTISGVEQAGGWTVRRRWSDPNRDGIVLRFRKRFGRIRSPVRFFGKPRDQLRGAGDAADVASGCLPEEVGLLVVAVLLAVVVFVFLWELFLFAMLAALGGPLLLVALVVVGSVARVVLRHPWTVQATHADGRVPEEILVERSPRS